MECKCVFIEKSAGNRLCGVVILCGGWPWGYKLPKLIAEEDAEKPNK
jgi:hypothetical protein